MNNIVPQSVAKANALPDTLLPSLPRADHLSLEWDTNDLEASLNPDALDEATPTGPGLYDVIIIGGGPAGLTAGIYTARGGLKTLVLEGEFLSNTEMPGGQLMLTPEIENYPGFPGGSGDALIEIMRDQTEKFGAEIRSELVLALTLDGTIRTVTTSEGVYSGRSIIVATGAVARRLGVTGEDLHFGRGVSVCATCDGAFFRDKTVVVVGGGDTAVEDALFLTKFAKRVYVVHRRDKLRSTSPEARTLIEHPEVTMVWNSTVSSILGDNSVECVELTNTLTGESSILAVDGVFVAIGHDPATQFLRSEGTSLVELTAGNYVLVNGRSTQTSVPGVFAAGDVADEVYRQAITAAASGCQAALDAERWLQHQDSKHQAQ